MVVIYLSSHVFAKVFSHLWRVAGKPLVFVGTDIIMKPFLVPKTKQNLRAKSKP